MGGADGFFYSLLACDLDRSLRGHSPFPVRSPRNGGTLQAPLCPLPSPVPRRYDVHQRNHKGETKERTKETTARPHIILLFRGCHEGGRGAKQRLFLPSAPSSSASTLPSSPLSLRSRSSHSGTSLCASFSAGAGTSLPTRWWRRSPVLTGCISYPRGLRIL